MTESISRKFSRLGLGVSETGTLTVNSATATKWATARTLTLSGDLSGNVSIDGSDNVTLTATVSGNTVALGTDTTGDYVASVTAGTGITTTGTGEGAAVTVALSASGVTANSYGSSTAVPVLTIDTYGRITSASTASVSSSINIAGDTGTDSVSLISDTLTVSGGTGLTSTVTNNTVTLDIDSTVATLTGSQTLTNKTISGADNTLSNIGNASLTNSSITVNGTSIALGASGTLYTDDVAEDASPVNLWFTNTRARSAVSATDAGGDGGFSYDSGTGVFTYTGPSAAEVRAHFSNGTGVTITNGQVAIGQAVATTDNVTFAGVTADNVRVGVTAAGEIDTSTGNLTLDSAGGTITLDDNATITGDLQIDGNLTVSGTTVTINATNLAVEDNMIYLNNGSTVTNPDLGFAGNYNDGTYRHAGVFRDATDGVFKFFHQYTPEPDASAYIDTSHGSFALASVQASTFTGNLVGNASTVTNGVYTTDTGTVTNTMLAGSIANNKLANSTISGVALGSNLGTLTLGVSGTGLSGSQTYNGSGAATFTVTSNATSANTGSTIVARDASGNFSAGTITATLSGNASTATSATSASNSTTTSQRAFTSDISTTGQGRFTGWYTGNAATGLATEAGVSSGQSYLISYNRDTSSYGVLNINGSTINIAPQGGSLTGPGGNVILHAGNYTSYTYTFDSLTSKGSGTGTYTTSGDFRAPIFYDSNDTTFYVNPNGKSELSSLALGYTSGTVYNTAGQGTLFFNNHGESDIQGYSIGTTMEDYGGNYTKLTIDWHTGIKIGAYTSYGGIRFYSNSVKYYGGSKLFSIGEGDGHVRATNVLFGGESVRSPIFYDSNDTGYYVDPRSASVLSGLKLNGVDNQASGGDYILWVNKPNNNDWAIAITGQLEYQFFYDGAASHSYGVRGLAAGSEYWRVGTDLLYHNSNIRAPIFYDSNNTGYYVNPDSTSYLYHLELSGGAYFQPNSWIQFNSSYGIYWPNHYGAHLYPNTGSTYTQLRIDGSKGGYSGMWMAHSGVNGMMYDSSGNGGVYREANGLWYFYYLVSNGCMGIGTSTTSSSYGVYVVKGGYFDGRVDGTIFYDANNTGYYCDPNSTSQLSYVLANDWFRPQNDTGLYFQSYGRGIWAADSGGNSYGNATTYGGGRNGWYGWGIGSRHVFMSTTGDNVGVHDNSRGWIWYWNGSYTEFPYGYTIHGGSSRSPIFYDQNDTGYYCDPASTSYMYRTIFQGRMLFYGADQSADGTNDAQIYFTPGGGLTIASITTTFETGFVGSSYPNNRQAGAQATYDKRFYVWQDLVQYYSDERLKEKTGTLAGALDAIKSWTPFKYVDNALANSFNFGSDKPQIGLSAQEVQQFYPELVELAPFDVQNDFSDETNPRRVSKSGENYLTLNYTRLVPVLVQAIKEQQAKIEELENRINNS